MPAGEIDHKARLCFLPCWNRKKKTSKTPLTITKTIKGTTTKTKTIRAGRTINKINNSNNKNSKIRQILPK